MANKYNGNNPSQLYVFVHVLIASDNNWAIIWCNHGFTFMDKQLQLTAISQKKIVVKIVVHIRKTC